MKIAAIRNYPLQMSFIPPVVADMRRATTIGTSLRTALVAHMSSVCRQTVLSSMTGHALWEKDVIAPPLAPVDG